MSGNTPQVDGYVRKNKPWQDHLQALRRILHETPLVEEVKWRVPCYTFGEKNVAFLGVLKEHCTLSFIKGALLKDPRKILTLPGPNSQSARVIRFTTVAEITKLQSTLKDYLLEAIELEKSGKKVAFKTIDQFAVPEELQILLDEEPKLKSAFKSLTPGRQRAYLMHIAGAKQPATRIARARKCIPIILAGKGLNDE